jgi:hypothetical protein
MKRLPEPAMDPPAAPKPAPEDWVPTPSDLSPDLREKLEERISLMNEDNRLSPQEAERLAMQDILRFAGPDDF